MHGKQDREIRGRLVDADAAYRVHEDVVARRLGAAMRDAAPRAAARAAAGRGPPASRFGIPPWTGSTSA